MDAAEAFTPIGIDLTKASALTIQDPPLAVRRREVFPGRAPPFVGVPGTALQHEPTLEVAAPATAPPLGGPAAAASPFAGASDATADGDVGALASPYAGARCADSSPVHGCQALRTGEELHRTYPVAVFAQRVLYQGAVDRMILRACVRSRVGDTVMWQLRWL